MRTLNPMSLWLPAFQWGFVALEAQSVIAMRLMGMAGFWSVASDENTRMVSEKAQAMTRATTDAAKVAMKGGSVDKVMLAAIKPVRRKTRSNVRRLGKRGPKLP